MATKPKRKNAYVMRGRCFFLTYPQCPLPPQDAYEQLYESLGTVKEYIVAQENHKDGGLHLHAYIALTKQRNFTSFDKFYLHGDNGKVFKGKFEKVLNDYRVQKYCKKDGQYITNMVFNKMAQAIEQAKAGDVDGAYALVCEARPDMALMGGSRVKANIQMMADDEKEEDPKFTVFINIPPLMGGWDREKQVLWLFGPTGLGKTEYARSLFEHGLLVRHKDQLKQITAKTDGIIFDDFNVSHWPRESVIHLTDLKNKSGIDVKHGVATIPKGMPRVFCSNTIIWPQDDHGAIKRRVYCINLTKKLYQEQDSQEPTTSADWDKVMGVDPPQGEYQRNIGDNEWIFQRERG